MTSRTIRNGAKHYKQLECEPIEIMSRSLLHKVMKQASNPFEARCLTSRSAMFFGKVIMYLMTPMAFISPLIIINYSIVSPEYYASFPFLAS